MLSRKESLCLFLVSVLLFSSFYSSSFFGINRITNIHRAYAQPIMGIQQQQQQLQQLQLKQRQQQPIPSIGNIQQPQIRGAQPYPGAGNSITSPYPPNQPALQQQLPQQQPQTVLPPPFTRAGNGIATRDTIPPDTVIISVVDRNNSPVQNGGSTQSNKIIFTIQGRDNVAVAGFQCSLDNAQTSNCAVPVVLNNLQPGIHVLQVRAVDAGGNVDPTPVLFRWNVVTPSPSGSFPAVSSNNQLMSNPLSSATTGKTRIASPSTQQQLLQLPQQQLSPITGSKAIPSSPSAVKRSNALQTPLPVLNNSVQLPTTNLIASLYQFFNQIVEILLELLLQMHRHQLNVHS